MVIQILFIILVLKKLTTIIIHEVTTRGKFYEVVHFNSLSISLLFDWRVIYDDMSISC